MAKMVLKKESGTNVKAWSCAASGQTKKKMKPSTKNSLEQKAKEKLQFEENVKLYSEFTSLSNKD